MTRRNALTRKMRPDPAAIMATDLARDRRRILAQPVPDVVALGAIEAVMDEIF
ncbi:hypothetical protein H6F75_00495 [Nodosilinea sp. FACHB-131]|uniref:hypothetical protein n=1 Tax=Cyanophyceae TaxID=3028117 RepID=UPI0016831A05|nr:hypothetical protein [Nodosilinea sp. FACHB-131]MBD1871949.1 hypothetical protein [Nodosilinea sp. FACHB-131]